MSFLVTMVNRKIKRVELTPKQGVEMRHKARGPTIVGQMTFPMAASFMIFTTLLN
jgi:hypothetical protein